MAVAYHLRDRDDLQQLPAGYDGDIMVSLDLLINGRLGMPDPHGPGGDVFMLGDHCYRPVRWDLETRTLVCYRVPPPGEPQGPLTRRLAK